MKIVVDAMGSDTHPTPDVAGAVLAAREFGDDIILVGDEQRIAAELAQHDTVGLKLHIRHASQVITMTDKPSEASRSKPDSSMHVGMNLVKNGEADAFVSAGNTGGILAVAMLHTLRRIRGVKRPALGVVFPMPSKPMVIDNGANADCKPEYLLQFAVMGSIYLERVRSISNPRIAILSNGEEEGKGNQLVKETIPLLEASGLNYIGNIEPKEFMRGAADLTVTDGFTGNVLIKTAEATASELLKLLRAEIMGSTRTKLGGLLAKPAFDAARKALDPDEIGGAPLLGVNGVVIIGHGRSNAYAIKQAVRQARLCVAEDVVSAIQAGIVT
ncbi:MAG: phosphate acyltransferase PlsX [Anaerolineae bacterium]|nr:phosphate acyltransferase PlsX [Anaerolineae bacterium]